MILLQSYVTQKSLTGFIVYWLKYATNFLIWLAELSKVSSYPILFYLDMYTLKLFLTKISVHTENICFDIQGAWTSQIFPRMDLKPVNKNILLYTDWNRGSPYTGVRTGVWSGQCTNRVNNALTQQRFILGTGHYLWWGVAPKRNYFFEKIFSFPAKLCS